MLWHETYRIDYPLGRGGFGITYHAFDTSLERQIAVKEFYPQEHAVREGMTGRLVVPVTKQDVYQRGLKHFLQEGSLLAKLDHPGVVRVYNSFQERETAYLAMELILGKTLRDELGEQPRKRLSVERVEEVMSKLVDALSIVHQQGICHLDLAPDNIMGTPEGRIILIDFGASRQGLGTSTTQAFKEAYAPPEVIDGKGTGTESDVFELGMMLYEMLTGELPPSSISRLLSLAHRGIELWDSSCLEEPWHGLVTGAIRLRPEERPHSVREWWSFKDPSLVPPYPRPHPSSGVDNKPAGFWLRLASDLIDRSILILSSALLHIALGLSASAQTTATSGDYFGQILFFYILLGLIYCPVMESSSKQGTLGKLIVGIAVTDTSGRRISLERALTRHTCKVFSYLSLFVGFLMAGFTSNKEALHDLIAKCLVVRRN
jgi:serine/threonine protein kinase